MNEQQLICLAAAGDDMSIGALARQYAPVVWRLRRQYYVRNFDEDDWLQEGRIAVYRAAKKYQRLRLCSFGAYYRVLLSNQIIDHIRRTQARKRRPEGELLSLDVDDEDTLCKLQTTHISTLDVVHVREQVRTFPTVCSPFEGLVFADLLAGHSPERIALSRHVEVSQVINATDRCRKKMRDLLQAAA
ncbi:sigma-70 family RNA polymerase sigma factor [Lactiplantibacillus paraplantarum]|uniref:DNA-directed RNA polymerase specialized sigma subunit n=1 Tax=Lactiplantibacillus paraplantarum TaxID=60520 RepID=A0AAD0TLG1_9LACO|nr:sigma-70 family RNA polymerase sigma factor [Lactiplantibacillus paraplantarum]AVW09570.1 DNA-directed RNA polymerase [Lactiplantibacillus paraplantarum]AYJ37784.1 sigma-70 family RNA polymerase sigma factor [Lactiplantibacillus paraplantarum]ERL44479.1 DNA-directed RNA polymerase, sigma factor 30 [Lactiplantibacillus paraplantarum]KRL50525.1 DNA-directed RNA polymerase, sigma factor 30 [Lactiplantibacillus paraplantarum DSM 10667]MCU4682736.1 sigma-70 family RNA polymerase sigma factor [La